MAQILALADRWPWPVRSGGQHRLAAMLHALHELGDLHLCVLRDPQPGSEGLRTAARAALPGAQIVEVPVTRKHVGWFDPRRSPRSPWWEPWREVDYRAIHETLRTALDHERFDVTWAYTGFGGPLLDGWAAKVRVVDLPELPDVQRQRLVAVVDEIGSFDKLTQRYVAANVRRAWRRIRRRICSQASIVTVCSETDRDALECTERVEVVPNGYDLPREPVGSPERPAARTLVFQGTMDYYPNADAAVFFARQVLPLVRRRMPDAEFRVVGPGGPALGISEIPGVVTVGEVEEIEDELAKAGAIVVPIRVGSGTRLKILEAWAHRIPVVSTTVGAEGLPSHTENILIADSAPDLADAIVRVLGDAELRVALAAAGRRTLEASLTWPDIQARWIDVLRADLAARPGSSTERPAEAE